MYINRLAELEKMVDAFRRRAMQRGRKRSALWAAHLLHALDARAMSIVLPSVEPYRG